MKIYLGRPQIIPAAKIRQAQQNPGANNASNQDDDHSRTVSDNITSQDSRPINDSKPDAEDSQNPDNSEAAESGPTEKKAKTNLQEISLKMAQRNDGQPLPPNLFAWQSQSSKRQSGR